MARISFSPYNYVKFEDSLLDLRKLMHSVQGRYAGFGHIQQRKAKIAVNKGVANGYEG